jgi:hypothetical protein
MKPRNKKPHLILDREGKKRHPLVVLAESLSTKEIGKLHGHANHSTASIYISRAKKRPTTPISAEWCLPVALYMGLAPATLRPDLYLPHWTVDNAN